jgi:hypothetical protein
MVNQSNKSIFAFTFTVHRTTNKKWYQFWLRNSAEVYSYVYCTDLDEAKNIVKNDMNKRGFDIIEFDNLNRLKEKDYPPENILLIKLAKKYGSNYRYFKLRQPEIDQEDNNMVPLEITSRYADIEDVMIDENKIPKELHDIIPYAKQWAISDDFERSKFLDLVAKEEIQEFYSAVFQKFDIIEEYCNQNRNKMPVPDEVVLFDSMLEAFTEISIRFK